MRTVESTLLAIDKALATGRIGTPVAARVVVHTLAQPDDIPLLQARLLAAACRWLGGRVATLFAHGSVQAGQISCLARLDGGQSLLMSVGTRGDMLPLAEVLVFGNHGVISAGEAFYLWPPDQDGVDLQLREDERQLAQLVRQSQQTRQAVQVTDAAVQASPPPRSDLSAPNFDIHFRAERRPVPPPFGVLLIAGDYTHQPHYAQALAADKRCLLVGLADEESVPPRRQELNERLAKRLGIRVLPNLAEALGRPDVHIVSICAEPERRARIITQAAAAGKHLYLDKPLCTSLPQAREVVAAVRRAKVLGHMFSQVPWELAQRVRTFVGSGALGEIRAVHCDLTFAKGHTGGAVLGHSRPEAVNPRDYELPDAKRELTNIGVYCAVTLLWLLKRNVRRVFAATENYFFAEHQQRDVEDFGQLLLELDGGITASVTAARTGWRSHPSNGLHRMYLVGSRGTARVDAYRPHAEIWSDGEPWLPPGRDPEDPMAMWGPTPAPFQARPKLDWVLPSPPSWSTDPEHFLDCLEVGHDTEVTPEIAAAATEVLLAGYRSAATRRVVELPLSE